MDTFEYSLLHNILINLPIHEIQRVCSSLPNNRYQQICKNEKLWEQLLYRDYSVFQPIIDHVTRDSPMSYYDLYQEFYNNMFFNSEEFREVYEIFSRFVPIVIFKGESIIPKIIENNFGSRTIRWIKICCLTPETVEKIIPILKSSNYKVIVSASQPGILGIPHPNSLTISLMLNIVNGKIVFVKISDLFGI